jgi:4-amino-4-deoxy-L-arabinose transferase-like glycosyltransferase
MLMDCHNSRTDPYSWWQHCLVISLVTGVLMGFYCNRDLSGSLETGYALVVQEMVRDGHWSVPTQNAKPRIVKPPLPFLASAAVVRCISGNSAPMAAIRLMSVVLAIGSALCIYFLGTRLLAREAGFWGALAWATSYLPLTEGRNAQHDAYLCAFVVLTMTGIWLLLERQRWGWPLTVLGIFLAFQTKGPVTLFLTVIPAAAYILTFQRDRWRLILALLGLCAFGMLSLVPWAWHMQRALGADLVRQYTWETVGRFNSSVVGRDSTFHYLHFVYYALPWTLFLVLALWMPFRREEIPGRRGVWFAWFWLVAAVLLMSLPREKTDRYMLPLMAPAALLIGQAIALYAHSECQFWTPGRRRLLLWAQTSLMFAITVGGTVLMIYKNWIPLWLALGALALLMVPVLAFALRARQSRFESARTALVIFGILLALFALAVQARAPVFREPLRPLARQVSEIIGDAPLYSWADTKPPFQLVYYLNRSAPVLMERVNRKTIHPGDTDADPVAVLRKCLERHGQGPLFFICETRRETELQSTALTCGWNATKVLDLTTGQPPRLRPRPGFLLVRLSPNPAQP